MKRAVKAIVVAGGYSKRLKLKLPKQLAKIRHKPILTYTLDVFERSRAIDEIVLVVQRNYVSKFRSLVKKYRYKKIRHLCLGGQTRQQSVFNGLKVISSCNYVLIHDGVRPFVTEKIIQDTLLAAKKFGAASSAVRAKDTIVEARESFVNKVLLRNRLWHIQTPQAFKFKLIYQAHQLARKKDIKNASDDAQLILKMKKKVKLIEASYENIKITTASDLILAQRLKKP